MLSPLVEHFTAEMLHDHFYTKGAYHHPKNLDDENAGAFFIVYLVLTII